MTSSEFMEMYNFTPENTSPAFLYPTDFTLLENNISSFQINRFLNNISNCQPPLMVQDFTHQPSSISNNSTSDEAEDHHHLSIIDERKKRRMLSNRESARRSRMRKQRHLDELWTQVIRLRTENGNIMEQLNNVTESYNRVLQENASLKDETSDLRQMLANVQLNKPHSSSQ